MPAKKRSGKGSTRDEETASLINEAILKARGRPPRLSPVCKLVCMLKATGRERVEASPGAALRVFKCMDLHLAHVLACVLTSAQSGTSWSLASWRAAPQNVLIMKLHCRPLLNSHLNTGAAVQSDVKELRRLACIRGLVSPLLRRTVWPLLLGIQPHHTEALPCKLHAEPGSRSARDEQTIRNDVARCLHESQIACVGENDREQLRETLVRILKAVVDGETIYYYQARPQRGSVSPTGGATAVAPIRVLTWVAPHRRTSSMLPH